MVGKGKTWRRREKEKGERRERRLTKEETETGTRSRGRQENEWKEKGDEERNRRHVLPGSGESFPNSPPSPKALPLISSSCHLVLTSPQGSIKIVPGEERDALAWPAKSLRCRLPHVWSNKSHLEGVRHRHRGEPRGTSGRRCWKGCLTGRGQEKLAEGWRGQGRPTGRQWQGGERTSHLSLSGRLRQSRRNLNLVPRPSCSVYKMKGPRLKSVSQLHRVPLGPPTT